MLLNNLPRDSAFIRAYAPQAAWGDSEHLLAGVIDAVRVGNYLAEVQASGLQLKGNKPKPPAALPRPTDIAKAGHGRSVAEIAPMLEAWREGRLTMIDTTATEV